MFKSNFLSLVSQSDSDVNFKIFRQCIFVHLHRPDSQRVSNVLNQISETIGTIYSLNSIKKLNNKTMHYDEHVAEKQQCLSVRK